MLTPPAYLLTMADFLDYIRRQRAEIKRQLAELDTAERVFRDSQGATATDTAIWRDGYCVS